MKIYKYDLSGDLSLSIISVLMGVKLILTGIKVVRSGDFMNLSWIIETFFILCGIFPILCGICILIFTMRFPPKISIDAKLHIKRIYLFSKEILWEDILSIKTVISLRMPRLIIEFLKEGKRRKIRISPLIIGYKELTEEIVEKAKNANIDHKTQAFLEGKLGHPEIFALWFARIVCFIAILLMILQLFV